MDVPANEGFDFQPHDLVPEKAREQISDKVSYELRPAKGPDGSIADGLYNAWITLNNPTKFNSYTTDMVKSVILAFRAASNARDVNAVVFTAAGDKAFCTGGDQSAHGDEETGSGYGKRGTLGLPVEDLQTVIRDIPKPVIARVQGFAIGGGNVLELARSGSNVGGVVSFHGDLKAKTPEDAKNIKGKVLVLHGADDPFQPKANRDAIEAEMRAAKVDLQLVAFSGAVHSFTDPHAKYKGKAEYNAKVAKRAFAMMRDFFDETL